jgi:RNA polymerase sigma-70 factor (ECF subfamily)
MVFACGGVTVMAGKSHVAAPAKSVFELNAVQVQEFIPEKQADRALRLLQKLDTAEENERDIDPQTLSGSHEEQIFALYDEFRPRLFGYLRSFRLNREEAEEVIQETFLELTTALVQRRNIENAQGWIIRAAHYLAMDVIKRKKRDAGRMHDASAFEFDSFRDQKLGPEEILAEKDRRQHMEAALSRFSPMQRECFHMRAQGFRYKDIGTALGVSTQRVALIVKQVTARLAAICG